jgi:hypothetical protein
VSALASLAPAVVTAVAPAAATPQAGDVSPGIAGFLVVFVLALATVLLIRSMVGHLRKVRYGPGPQEPGEPGKPGSGGADGPPPEARPGPATPRGPQPPTPPG